MPANAHITGWGSYLPERRLTNDELAARLDTSDEWIRSHTGISERRIASDGESTASMAIEAAKQALLVANLEPRRLDLIIVATISPEFIFPATACLVQDAIGAKAAAAFDISAGCSGFVYALALADQAIRSGSAKAALVIGSETLSRFVDWDDRRTCILFADGAGAVVVQASDMPGGILSTCLGSDGSGADLLFIPAGGARRPASAETLSQREHYIQMDGRAVYRFAVNSLARSTRLALEKAGLDLRDMSLLIPHQANGRIISAAAEALGVSEDRIVEAVAWCGNTSSASIPIALCQAIADGRIKEGDVLVLSGFGAGLTWGAAAIRWSRLPTEPGRLRLIWYRTGYRAAATRSRLRRLWRRWLAKLAAWFANGSNSSE
jgi:3-oxoacyl-[acyl-carrier-protein] synthase-3